MSLTPVQQAILIDLVIHDETDKAENIGRRTSFHRNTVSTHMGKLRDAGYLHAKGGGVYRLTDQGRDLAQSLIRSGQNPYVDDSDDDN